MTNGNMCYGTVGGSAPRQLPSLWSPSAETTMPSHGKEDDGERSISQRLFGKQVTLLNCGGPCVSNDALEQAFAGCVR
jgi:hypothetical protein